VGSGGRTGTGGVGGGGGGRGGGGGGGGQGGAASACPRTMPTAGEACPREALACVYEMCGGPGHVDAYCAADLRWQVQSQPCASSACLNGAGPCAPGQICATVTSGTVTSFCAPNPCGSGPISAACLCSGCSGTCQVLGLGGGGTGITVTCNNCPAPMACP
jgi:hypothetical protein